MLTEDSPRFNNIPGLKLPLADHQKAMVRKSLEVERDVFGAKNKTPFGVFSDPPGAGKTPCLLCLVLLDKYLRKQSKDPKNFGGGTLVVVPQHLFVQWANAITKFAGDTLTVKKFVDYSDITGLYGEASSTTTVQSTLDQYDILLTTSLYYDVVSSTVTDIGIKLRRVIFDEVDSIKDMLRRKFPSSMTWMVSASIATLFDRKTNTVEIGKGYKLQLSDLLEHEVACDPEFIKRCFVLPPPEEEVVVCRNKYVEALAPLLTPQQLAALNGCDSVPAVGEWTPDDRTTAVRFQQQIAAKVRDKVDRVTYLKRSVTRALPDAVQELRQQLHLCEQERDDLQQQLEICEERFTDIGVCTLCCSPCEEVSQTTCCSRRACKRCLEAPCALCTPSAQVPSLIPEGNITRPKMAVLSMLLRDKLGKKVLVYSDHPRSFVEIQKMLDDDEIWVDLDAGNVPDIQEALKGFQEGATRILFASSRVLSAGLNLEVTSDIVLLHQLPPSAESQLIGRAQRYGRSTTLNVYILLHPNESP